MNCMINARRALLGLLLALCLIPPAAAQVSGGRLPTRWDKDVSPTAPLPEYPRPQMARREWRSLNGPWDYALTDKAAAAPPAAFSGKILVPYPYEAALSGVGKPSIPGQRLWYRRTFRIPGAWRKNGQRVLLHFGAVNWDATVALNGVPIGAHRGGYDAFTFDVTGALKTGADASNELTVSARNPLLSDTPDAQVLGKQRVRPGGIFYTAATGIWQSVWLEPVPAAHIEGVKTTPDVDAGLLRVAVDTSGGGAGGVLRVTATDGGRPVATVSAPTGTEIVLRIPKPHLWSPEDPHLYGLRVRLAGRGGDDAVDAYFAMRKVSLGKDAQGRTRIFLNNRFVFQVGALDQGYWPDGIYTAPTDDALRSDIEAAKRFGFNLLRKHAKVEPDRWYYWADRLGMLVWQDMPQCFGGPGGALTEAAKGQWPTEWKREIAQHYDHPCIIVWTTFNEGWGQHDTEQIVALTKRLDPTRLVNDASGWTDKGVGDVHDTHAYPGPACAPPETNRASVNGEFGGVTMRAAGHMWTADVMGYGKTLRSGWKVTEQYQKLLRSAYGLRDDPGASAVVYTQLTDVEQESNGILTYDRAVVKPLADVVAAANRGRFLPLPPAPAVPPDLVPTAEDAPRTWAYTTAEPAADWAQPGFDASGWKTGPAPFGHGAAGVRSEWADTPGDIWMRQTVTLPAAIPARLDVLARHDEGVEVYVNGVLAATATGYTNDYARLPVSDAARAALKPGGPNVIAVHCRQTTGGQVIDVGIAAAEQPGVTN